MERSEAGGLPCGGWRVAILSAMPATIRFPFDGKTRSPRYLLVVPGVVRLPGAGGEAGPEAGSGSGPDLGGKPSNASARRGSCAGTGGRRRLDLRPVDEAGGPAASFGYG